MFNDVDHVDDGPGQEEFVECRQLADEDDEPFYPAFFVRQRAGFVEFGVKRRRQNRLRQLAQEEFEKAGDDVRIVVGKIHGLAAIVSVL